MGADSKGSTAGSVCGASIITAVSIRKLDYPERHRYNKHISQKEGRNEMQTELTQVSDNQYHLIASRSLSPRMAAKHLKEGNLELRKFPDVLSEMYIGDDLMLRLIQAFQEDTPEANPIFICHFLSIIPSRLRLRSAWA